MSRLLDFYLGEAADAEGRSLADILGWSDNAMEEVHASGAGASGGGR